MWSGKHIFILSVVVSIVLAHNRHSQATNSRLGERKPKVISLDNGPEKVVLLQHSGTCTGMFWRGDPTTGQDPPTEVNWPRNGSLLRGTGPHVVDGVRWFKVSQIQQAGVTGFVPVPEGTWMLYEQNGPLLRDI